MFTNHMYNHLTMSKQTELLVLSSCAWSRSIVCGQLGFGFLGMLSTKYSFGNIRFNVYKQDLVLNGL